MSRFVVYKLITKALKGMFLEILTKFALKKNDGNKIVLYIKNSVIPLNSFKCYSEWSSKRARSIWIERKQSQKGNNSSYADVLIEIWILSNDQLFNYVLTIDYSDLT